MNKSNIAFKSEGRIEIDIKSIEDKTIEGLSGRKKEEVFLTPNLPPNVIVSPEIKRMDIKEFREMGLLAEVNRIFFHPLGLALEIIVDDDGTEKLGGIWDYRDDPEGMLYSKEHFPTEKIKKAQEFIKQKHEQRMKNLGFIYQDPNNPQ